MNGTYAMVIDGINGTFQERQLGYHAPGIELSPTCLVLENVVTAQGRTILVERNLTLSNGIIYFIPNQWPLRLQKN